MEDDEKPDECDWGKMRRRTDLMPQPAEPFASRAPTAASSAPRRPEPALLQALPGAPKSLRQQRRQQLCKPLLIHLVSFIESIVVRDHGFALNWDSQYAPIPWIRTSSHSPVLALPALSFTAAFFPQSAPTEGFAILINSYLAQSAAALASPRRRRIRRRASQELTKKQALTAQPGW
ncbi:hypothetical protein V8C35DRAFT_282770 [Trichoderma chlorosporum]